MAISQYTEAENFNSHLHAGGDIEQLYAVADFKISTHTSTREVTLFCHTVLIAVLISTHTSTREVT